MPNTLLKDDTVPASGIMEEEERTHEAGGLLERQKIAKEAQSRTSGITYPDQLGQPKKAGILDNPYTFSGNLNPGTNERIPSIRTPHIADNPFQMDVPAPDPVFVPAEAELLEVPGDKRLDVSVVDFLFGGEMAVAGMKYDNAGIHWNMDIAKQQWSEQPVWLNLLNTTSLVGTMLFPAARAAWAMGKFGKGATIAKRLGGLTHADEVSKFRKLGILEDADEAVSSKTLELARRQEWYRTKYQDMAQRLEKAAKGEGNFSTWDKIRLQFDKRFANKYFQIAGSLVNGEEDVRTAFYKNLDQLSRSEDLGKLFVNIPDEAAGTRIYQHLLNRIRPGLTKAAELSPAERAWADMFESAARSHQLEALEHGLIDSATVKKVGELHLPALNKGTPRPDLATTRQYYVPISRKATAKEIAEGVANKGDKIEVLRPYHMPRLDSPTLKVRSKELPEVAQRLLSGELITDPTELTVRGHLMDRLLLNNYRTVTDIATNGKFAIGAHDLVAKFGSRKAAEKAGYVSLDQLQGNIPTTLRRMIGKKDASFLGADGALPWVRRHVFEDMFGEAGIFAQTQMASGVFELLTTAHKTAKTATNIPTHFQNLASNLIFLAQAGFNVLSPQNLKTTKEMAGAFNKIAKAQRLAADAAKLGGGKVPTRIDELGIKLGKIKIGNKTFDLTEELMDPKVRELIEDSAFESVEGFQNIERMAENMPSGFTKGLAKTLVGSKKILQLGDKEGFRWFDQMTKWYLGEDMVPKMTYYMNLRAQGLTKEAAILEVGRRLPMYGTIGSAIKGARRVVLPWASFPVEALRITKNNLMDHPLRALPWLQMPGIIQSFAAAYGGGPGTKEETESAKRQLPMWAQTSQTVMMNERAGNAAGAALTGGLAGATAGVLKGGAAGAAVGGVLGAMGAAGIADYFSDKESSDRLRGVVLDWLPHTSLNLASTSPEFGGEILPFKDIQGALEQMPAEPLAIYKPLMDIAYGKNAWGEDLGAYDVGDQVGKAIAGMIGFVAPPFIQKYGLRTTTPDIAASEYMFGEPIAGDITNVSKLLMDSGLKVDPATGKPGNFTNEMFLKNFGMWKSWAADPANKLMNEQSTEFHFQEVRSYASKNLAYYLENGEDEKAADILSKVMATFSNQYADDPRAAQEKYGEWLKKRAKAIGKHPRLRSWSEKEIEERLTKTIRFSADERGRARDEMMKFLSNQLTNRRLQRLRDNQEKRYEMKENKRGRFTRPRYRAEYLKRPSSYE